MLHLFRWDREAVAVPARSNPCGARYKLGAWKCVMCKILLDFAVTWDPDHYDDCPGNVTKITSALRKVNYVIAGYSLD